MKFFNKNNTGLLFFVVIVVFFVTGCGETVRGLGRDMNRVGRGVKTIFVSD